MNHALEGVPRELGRPILIEPLFESTALIGPAVVVIAGRHVGCNCREMGWLSYSSQHLCCAYVGGSHHPHFAVGIGECRSPLDSIIAIGLLMPERVPLAL